MIWLIQYESTQKGFSKQTILTHPLSQYYNNNNSSSSSSSSSSNNNNNNDNDNSNNNNNNIIITIINLENHILEFLYSSTKLRIKLPYSTLNRLLFFKGFCFLMGPWSSANFFSIL